MTLLKDPDTNTRVRHDPWREILCAGVPMIVLLGILLPWENHPWFGHRSEVSSNTSTESGIKVPPQRTKKPGKKPDKTHPVRPVPTVTGDSTPTPGEPEPTVTVVTLTPVPVPPTEGPADPVEPEPQVPDPEPVATPEGPVTVEPAPVSAPPPSTETPGAEVSW